MVRRRPDASPQQDVGFSGKQDDFPASPLPIAETVTKPDLSPLLSPVETPKTSEPVQVSNASTISMTTSRQACDGEERRFEAPPSLTTPVTLRTPSTNPSHFRGHTSVMPQTVPSDSLTMHSLQSYLATIAREASIAVATQEHKPFPISRRPTFLTDFSDCFRLYFGSNMAIFPFLVTLGGSALSPFITVGVALVLHETVVSVARCQEGVMRLSKGSTRLQHDDVNSLVKLSDAVWRSNSRQSLGSILVRGVVLLSQFFAACDYAVLLGTNLDGLIPLGTLSCTVVSCVAMIIWLTLLNRSTSKYYVLMSNTGMFVAGMILLSQAIAAISSRESNESGGNRLLPRSRGDVLLMLPILTGYLSPTLYAPDVEANMRDREESGHSHEASISNETVVSSSWTSSSVCEPNRRRFLRLALIALLLSVVLLLSFGEVMFWAFGDHTSAVVALTLPNGVAKTILLVVFVVGLNANAAINVAALFDVLDSMHLLRLWITKLAASNGSIENQSYSQGDWIDVLEPWFARCCVFVGAFVVVTLIPFYDLLTALTGSTGYTMFTFFLPLALEIRLSVLDIASKKIHDRRNLQSLDELEDMVINEANNVTLWDAFSNLALRQQCSVCCFAMLGSIVLVLGTATALAEAYTRR